MTGSMSEMSFHKELCLLTCHLIPATDLGAIITMVSLVIFQHYQIKGLYKLTPCGAFTVKDLSY